MIKFVLYTAFGASLYAYYKGDLTNADLLTYAEMAKAAVVQFYGFITPYVSVAYESFVGLFNTTK